MRKSKCTSCLKILPESSFYKTNVRYNSGLSYPCRECNRKRVRKWEINNPEKKREKERNSYDPKRKRSYHEKTMADPEKRAATIKRHAQNRAKYPHKNRARGIAQRAVRSGKIKKPEHCSFCGKAGTIQGHHNDYSKPLELEWLCVKCHRRKHAGLLGTNQIATFQASTKE